MTAVAEPTQLVVHGHFYQPPRENPWTEEVPVEPSAAPFHDWNERITAECYRPNGWARVVDEHGRVAGVVNNYEHLSFNVGPTLLSWLATHHPDVLARMVDADVERGGAIAQAYNHLILPLANERDVRTQVRWGLADFAHRFGRPATAMWLPETAVSDEVLRVLVEEGVRATILAPGQAMAVRSLDGGDWVDVPDDSVATGVPHRWTHPDGGSIDLVFYEGGLSHDLAFALSGLSSQDLVQRVRSTGADGSPVVVATDGETFGHHHHWADRSLAYAFAHEAPANGVRVLRLPELLAEVPATHEARVRVSAWSCAHGVGRWREDCGCSTGGEPGWDQRWRAPLRAALDELRDHGIEVFERRGGAVFDDPWAARDDYVRVLLGATTPASFVAMWARPGADAVEALSLVEAQRQALLMYTSCGWFFNDLAGIETVQVLRYAARLLDLLAELGEDDEGRFEGRFLEVLGQARSNRPEEGTGADIWRRHVVPSRVDAGRVVAHLALLDLLEQREAGGVVGGHRVVAHEHRHRRRGGVVGVGGRIELEHARTGRASTHVYAAVRLGGLEVVGAVRAASEDLTVDEAAFARLEAAAADGARATTVLRVVAEEFGPREFGLEAALPDAAGDIVASAATALADRFGAALERLWDDNRDVLGSLAVAGHRLEPELRAPVEFAVGRRLRTALAVVSGPEGDDAEAAVTAVREATDAAWEAERLAVSPAVADGRASECLADAVLAAVRRALDAPGSDTHLRVVRELLRLRRPLALEIDLDRPQELVVDALAARPADDGPRALAELLGVAVGPSA
jgi:alpha-amylase/alpha-mannosidase (GH57 family)